MLNSEKNAFFAALEGTDFGPPSFDYEEIEPKEYHASENLQTPGVRLTFPGSRLWFAFFKGSVLVNRDRKEPLFACRWSEYNYATEQYVLYDWFRHEDGIKRSDDRGHPCVTHLVPLAAACQALTEWVTRVLPSYVQEAVTPDLWLTRQVTTPVAQIAPNADDEPFSASEREAVARAIVELREHILTSLAKTDEDAAEVTRRLASLSRAISQMGKASWITFAVGTVVSIASTLTLSNEDGKRLLEVTRDVLNTALRFYIP